VAKLNALMRRYAHLEALDFTPVLNVLTIVQLKTFTTMATDEPLKQDLLTSPPKPFQRWLDR